MPDEMFHLIAPAVGTVRTVARPGVIDQCPIGPIEQALNGRPRKQQARLRMGSDLRQIIGQAQNEVDIVAAIEPDRDHGWQQDEMLCQEPRRSFPISSHLRPHRTHQRGEPPDEGRGKTEQDEQPSHPGREGERSAVGQPQQQAEHRLHSQDAKDRTRHTHDRLPRRPGSAHRHSSPRPGCANFVAIDHHRGILVIRTRTIAIRFPRN